MKREVLDAIYYWADGTVTKEKTLEDCLGVDMKCPCRDVLDLGEVRSLEWVADKEYYGNRKYWYLEGLNTYDNLAYNTAIITSSHEVDKFGRRFVRYGLEISSGPYGEDGLAKTYEPKTRLSDVKKDAMSLITKAYREGRWYFYLRNACGSDVCDKCLIKEVVCN